MSAAEWKRISQYVISDGTWQITKYFLDGSALYVLMDADGTRYGNFESADDAKDFARRMELSGQA